MALLNLDKQGISISYRGSEEFMLEESFQDDTSSPSAVTTCSSSTEEVDNTAEVFHQPYKNDKMSQYILVTGGAGYIGSHTVVEMFKSGYIPIVVDNCSNATAFYDEEAGCMFPVSIRRVEEITGKSVKFYNVDLTNMEKLDKVFQAFNFYAVVHFAGLKSVTESVAKPLQYYEINLGATMNLVNCMTKHGVRNLIFSSSATVYGPPKYLPVDECHPVGQGITNPYGKTKYFIEEILGDLCLSDPHLRVILLRYFNPVGSHASGRIGEDPQGIPNNLMPYVSQVAIGRREVLSVFGNDYDTPDGTGVRDFIHVVDLAEGHISALDEIQDMNGCTAINLGTGCGYSVLEAVAAFEKASGRKVPYKFAPRRAGDLGDVHANPELAKKLLNWEASKDLEDMCKDLWKWQAMNPQGYNPNVKD